jgi:hypothetical protein
MQERIHASFGGAAAGGLSIIAANATAGYDIWYLSYRVSAQVTVQWRSGTDVLSGAMPHPVDGGGIESMIQFKDGDYEPAFRVAENKSFNVLTSGAANVAGHVIYSKRGTAT